MSSHHNPTILQLLLFLTIISTYLLPSDAFNKLTSAAAGKAGKGDDDDDVPGVSPANLGGQPSWLPPTPAWDIQPWESPPVGGGAPPQAVVYRSNTQAFPPTANSDHRFPYRDAHAYAGQNSPNMPMPGPGADANSGGTGVGKVVDQPLPFTLPGGVTGTTTNSACYQQCVHRLGVDKTAALTEPGRQAMVASCLQGCGMNGGSLGYAGHPLTGVGGTPFLHPSTLSPLGKKSSERERASRMEAL